MSCHPLTANCSQGKASCFVRTRRTWQRKPLCNSRLGAALHRDICDPVAHMGMRRIRLLPIYWCRGGSR
jgi:hypothetical protein